MFVNVPAKGNESKFKPLYGIDANHAESIYREKTHDEVVSMLADACASGNYLRVKPKKGAALLWYNYKPNGTPPWSPKSFAFCTFSVFWVSFSSLPRCVSSIQLS